MELPRVAPTHLTRCVVCRRMRRKGWILPECRAYNGPNYSTGWASGVDAHHFVGKGWMELDFDRGYAVRDTAE